MRASGSSFLLAGAVVAAALVAAFQTQRKPVRHEESEARLDESPPPSSDESEEDELPPNHPPIGRSSIGATARQPNELGQEPEGEEAIVWKVPARWKSVPNPSAMRIATYRVPAAAGAADEAEMSVVRAGGSTEANIERWVSQFTDRGSEKRTQKKVHGLETSTVEVSGTYQAGGMTTADEAAPRSGWTLKGAVVKTDQGLYFFKLTGPSASIKAARSDFDALVDSISPTSRSAL